VRRALATLVLVAPALVPASATGQEGFASTGGTGVTVDSPFVTITATIDLVVGNPGAEGLAEWASAIAQQISDYWTDGLAQASSCPLYQLEVTIDPVASSAVHEIPVARGTTLVTVPGHHVVLWEGTGPNAPWPQTFDAYDEDGIANPGEDSANAYGHELWAVWSGHLDTPRDFAHEFGHLLGFGDDYRQSGLPIPERMGTLMADGDRIDDVLARRLGDIVRRSGARMSECWTGTMDLALSKDYLAEPTGLPPEVCSGSWRVTPTFWVANDGSIAGSASARLTSGPECTFEFPGSGRTAEFNVGGTAQEGQLDLRFTQTGIEPPGDWVGFPGAMTTAFRVQRVSPTHAEAEVPIATTDAGPFPVRGQASIALDCSTCSAAAGGGP
jgi:hypothetical protein